MSDQKHTPAPWRGQFSRPCSWFIREYRLDLPGHRRRIEACVNALEGIEDPRAFVEASMVLLGFAAAHTGSGCMTATESASADATLNNPDHLSGAVETMRRCMAANIKGDD